MALEHRIKEARKRAHLTQEQAASLIGVAKSTWSGYENGNSQPDIQKMVRIMDVLNVDANYLWQDYQDEAPALHAFNPTPQEIEGIKKYRALDAHGKEMVDFVFRKETERVSSIRSFFPVVSSRPFRISEQRASAGLGCYLGPESFRTVTVHSDALPHKAAFGVPVAGDSMEPRFHDGDILIISTEQPLLGEVGLFTLDGQGYVKELGDGELVSLNSAYAPIPMDESIICNGKVVGTLDADAIVE